MLHLPPPNRRCTEQGSGFTVQGSVPTRKRSGLTLIELLLTLAILGILAAILIPQLSGDLPERLNAAAQVVSTDLDYARALAVANNSSYAITFDPTNNLYYLRHTGANAQFNTLPASPYRQTNDTPDKQTTNLSQLPLPEPGVQLVVATQMQGTGQATTTLEFNSLGGTTSTYQTVIWLGCGSGLVKRYISVQVDPVTGMVTIGPLVTGLPSAITSLVQSGSVTAAQDSQGVSGQTSQTKLDSGS